MLKMIRGVTLANTDKLYEGYTYRNDRIIASVNADKMQKIIEGFIKENNDTDLFLFIEVPANLDDENVVEKYPNGGIIKGPMHNDVYYLDGISPKALIRLLEPFYEILINDGLSSFGVGNPYREEIGKYKYNEMILFSHENTEKYVRIFDRCQIPFTDDLVTAYDNVSPETPGICEMYTDPQGRDIYSVIELLSECGLYKAEQREE